MATHQDFLIIGAGFSGSVIAREMAEHGAHVLIIERRNHIAGNMYDFYDEQGLLLHKYGPHTFHTNDKELVDYISQYAKWEDYKLTCMVHMEGLYTPSPFNFQTIDDYFSVTDANQIKEELLKEYGESEKVTITDMLECKNHYIKQFADFLFEKDYRPYTAKQWGISPEEIDIEVLRRVPVVLSYKTGYFDDAYQCLPKYGYTKFFESLLAHPNIHIQLGVDARSRLRIDIDHKRVYFDGEQAFYPIVYSGAVDELLNYKYGELPYRSLQFVWNTDSVDSFQLAPIVAYPQAKDFTRITEYKKMPAQHIQGVSTYAIEYPIAYVPGEKNEPYYPVLNEKNNHIYQQYRNDATVIPNLFLCGRLAEYKYYNMDQTLQKALALCEELKSKL